MAETFEFDPALLLGGALADVDVAETFEFDPALLLGPSTLPKATCAPLLLRLPIDEFLPCCCKGISAVQNIFGSSWQAEH